MEELDVNTPWTSQTVSSSDHLSKAQKASLRRVICVNPHIYITLNESQRRSPNRHSVSFCWPQLHNAGLIIKSRSPWNGISNLCGWNEKHMTHHPLFTNKTFNHALKYVSANRRTAHFIRVGSVCKSATTSVFSPRLKAWNLTRTIHLNSYFT